MFASHLYGRWIQYYIQFFFCLYFSFWLLFPIPFLSFISFDHFFSLHFPFFSSLFKFLLLQHRFFTKRCNFFSLRSDYINTSFIPFIDFSRVFGTFLISYWAAHANSIDSRFVLVRPFCSSFFSLHPPILQRICALFLFLCEIKKEEKNKKKEELVAEHEFDSNPLAIIHVANQWNVLSFACEYYKNDSAFFPFFSLLAVSSSIGTYFCVSKKKIYRNFPLDLLSFF